MSGLFAVVSGSSLNGGSISPPGQLSIFHLVAVATASVAAVAIALFSPRRRSLGWAAVALGLLLGLLRAAPVTHAFLGLLYVGLCAVITLSTSPWWSREPVRAADYGWPSSRTLAIVTPSLLIAQVLAGASYKHGSLGLAWHVTGAMLVGVVNLTAGAFAVQQFSQHPTLPKLAKLMMGATFTQLFLGMTVITLAASAELEHSTAALVVAVAHASTGALTLGATLAFAMDVRRCVMPKVAS